MRSLSAMLARPLNTLSLLLLFTMTALGLRIGGVKERFRSGEWLPCGL